MPGNCHLREKWLGEDQFRNRLKRGQSNTTAYCNVCKKSFDISSMGRTALRSHLKGKKHQELAESTSTRNSF